MQISTASRSTGVIPFKSKVLHGSQISTKYKAIFKKSKDFFEVTIVLSSQNYVGFKTTDLFSLDFFYGGLKLWFSACRNKVNFRKKTECFMVMCQNNFQIKGYILFYLTNPIYRTPDKGKREEILFKLWWPLVSAKESSQA